MGGWAKRDVVVGNRRIATREKPGAEGTLILLHGLGAHQRTWDRTAKALEGFRLITFDYRGHGRSDPAHEYSVDGFLEDLQAVIRRSADADDYVLVGHSIGADLALLSAPPGEGCRGVVLVDGAFHVAPPPTDWERFSILEERLFFRILTSVGRRMGIAPSMSVQQIRSLAEDLESRRLFFRELLSDLRIPALYVVGDQPDRVRDGSAVHDRKMKAAAEISSRDDVRVEYVPCGHLVPMSQPRRLADLVRGFARAALP